MRLDPQVRFNGGMASEALDRISSRRTHVGERRVATNLIVARKLQREEEERLAVERPQRVLSLARTEAVGDVLPAPACCFHQGRARSVSAIEGVGRLAGMNCNIVSRRVADASTKRGS